MVMSMVLQLLWCLSAACPYSGYNHIAAAVSRVEVLGLTVVLVMSSREMVVSAGSGVENDVGNGVCEDEELSI